MYRYVGTRYPERKKLMRVLMVKRWGRRKETVSPAKSGALLSGMPLYYM
jgi:hypothetical protein